MNTANFICTLKDDEEIILMGFLDDDEELMNKMYSKFYEYGHLDVLYIKIAPITYENKKYII